MTFPAEIIPEMAYALVLGRGGSKGLPGKNVRILGGKPLVAWSVAAGCVATSVKRVLCSTDDPAIAQAAENAGAEIPFLRPAEFATSSATDLDVFGHAISWLADNEGHLPEFFVQLRPTTPFRHASWIDSSIARMVTDPSITCVRTVAPAPHTPYKMWKMDERFRLSPLLTLPGVSEPYNMPRQSLPTVWWHTGQLDVIRTSTLLAGSVTGANIVGIEVPASSTVDIDTMTDFQLAELSFATEIAPDLVSWLNGREWPNTGASSAHTRFNTS